MRRVVSLDLLRGLAAFSVAIPHFFVYYGTGVQALETFSVIAVEVFFVLSGFVLGPQIMFCLDGNRLANLWTFLVRRWMRTIPPYLVALVFASLLFGQLFKKSFWLYSIYIQNLLDMDSLNDYFPVAWSLSIEEWFYLTFPVTLLAVSFFTAKRRATVALVVGISYALTITVFRTVYGDYSHWGLDVRRVVAYRLDSVAYGFLLFLAHRERLSLQVSRFPATAYFLALLVASFGIFLVTRDAAAGGVFSKHAFPFVAAVFGMLAIHWFSLLNESIQRIPLMTPLSLFLGRISYSIYLFHLVVLLALKAIPTSLDILSQFALYLAILIAFAAGFYQWVEKPILAARPDFRARVDLGRDELGRTRPPILNMSASS